MALLAAVLVLQASAAPAPGSRQDCADCPPLVLVPAGSFLLGNAAGEGESDEFVFEDGLPDPVTVSRPFWIGSRELTVGEFRAFVRATGYETTAEKRGGCLAVLPGGYVASEPAWNWRHPGYAQTEAHPVTCVSWTDAMAYVTWLRRVTHKAYRLVSEAEFEYVARAGARKRFGAVDQTRDLCQAGNVGDRDLLAFASFWTVARCADGHPTPAAAGTFGMAPWGVHDLYGNLQEWTADCYTTRYGHFEKRQGAWRRVPSDSQARATDCALPIQRVLRGADWLSAPSDARMGRRTALGATFRSNWVGIRVALDVEAPASRATR